jgi:hypothetical protein
MKQLKGFDMKTTLARLATSRVDPWSKYNQLKQRVQLLEVKKASGVFRKFR